MVLRMLHSVHRTETERSKRRWPARALWLGLVASLGACFTNLEGDMAHYQPRGAWVIDGPEAARLHSQGARFLDARDRGGEAFAAGHLRGAVAVHWSTFSQSEDPLRGRLLADDQLLEERLRAAGVSATQPVVVLGSPLDGWGEDGRIVWMLRALGHPRALLVDGGYHALLAADLPLVSGNEPPPPRGDFVVDRDPSLSIDASALQALLASGSGEAVRLIDTREPGEFAGLTPYGESRGGHLPGAVHLYYRELLDDLGYLRSEEALRGVLASRGIMPQDEIIAYCTGGVRSGWLVAILGDLGYQRVRNYPGSMWEWSSLPAATHPLVTAPQAP